MERRRCELCGKATATMYCESDAASLCLRCDEKVHGANFLVAKHERSLLCSVCQCMTSWKASGPRLGRTVSVCDGCVCDRKDADDEHESTAAVVEKEVVVEVESWDRSDGDEEPDRSSDDDEDDDEDEEEEEDDEDEENQVVPWSSGEEVSSSSICGKRRRDVADLDSDAEIEDGGGSRSEDWDRSRMATRLIGLNRNFWEIKPTTPGFRAGNQTSRISG